VAAALALANASGDFSMRALGQRLRVDPMAIYRHFRDKDALLEAMVDAALADFEAPPADAGDPVERLRQMGIGFRRALMAHPGVALRVATTRPVLGPHTLALTEACVALLTELGLGQGEAIQAYSALVRYITGVAGAEQPVHSAGTSETDWQEEMRSAYASLPAGQYPHLSRMADEFLHRGFDEQFEFGLDLLLDALVERGRRNRAADLTPGDLG
jgi:AcrR family transcriptional regulator